MTTGKRSHTGGQFFDTVKLKSTPPVPGPYSFLPLPQRRGHVLQDSVAMPISLSIFGFSTNRIRRFSFPSSYAGQANQATAQKQQAGGFGERWWKGCVFLHLICIPDAIALSAPPPNHMLLQIPGLTDPESISRDRK